MGGVGVRQYKIAWTHIIQLMLMRHTNRFDELFIGLESIYCLTVDFSDIMRYLMCTSILYVEFILKLFPFPSPTFSIIMQFPRYQKKLLSKWIHIFCCLFLPVSVNIYEVVFISVCPRDFIVSAYNVIFTMNYRCNALGYNIYYKILCVLNIIVYRSALNMITVNMITYTLSYWYRTFGRSILIWVAFTTCCKSKSTLVFQARLVIRLFIMFPWQTSRLHPIWSQYSRRHMSAAVTCYMCMLFISQTENKNFFTSSRFQERIILTQL